MAAGIAHLIRLLHWQDAGRVRPLFQLWPTELGTTRLDDEVRAGAAATTARVAAAAPRAAGRSIRQATHALDDGVAFDVGIEDVCRADLHREIAAHLDRIDGNDRGRARDARSLHGAQTERSATHNRHDRSWRNGRERTGRR